MAHVAFGSRHIIATSSREGPHESSTTQRTRQSHQAVFSASPADAPGRERSYDSKLKVIVDGLVKH
jgi:hypothetical protein